MTTMFTSRLTAVILWVDKTFQAVQLCQAVKVRHETKIYEDRIKCTLLPGKAG